MQSVAFQGIVGRRPRWADVSDGSDTEAASGWVDRRPPPLRNQGSESPPRRFRSLLELTREFELAREFAFKAPQAAPPLPKPPVEQLQGASSVGGFGKREHIGELVAEAYLVEGKKGAGKEGAASIRKGCVGLANGHGHGQWYESVADCQGSKGNGQVSTDMDVGYSVDKVGLFGGGEVKLEEGRLGMHDAKGRSKGPLSLDDRHPEHQVGLTAGGDTPKSNACRCAEAGTGKGKRHASIAASKGISCKVVGTSVVIAGGDMVRGACRHEDGMDFGECNKGVGWSIDDRDARKGSRSMKGGGSKGAGRWYAGNGEGYSGTFWSIADGSGVKGKGGRGMRGGEDGHKRGWKGMGYDWTRRSGKGQRKGGEWGIIDGDAPDGAAVKRSAGGKGAHRCDRPGLFHAPDGNFAYSPVAATKVPSARRPTAV